jgi:hypothetical protein
MVLPTIEEIRDETSRCAFGDRVVQNNLRAMVVETIVDFALKPGWERAGGNWNGWDFAHTTDGTRLEVKQSARLQTWRMPDYQGAARFDIAPRSGYYDGAIWNPIVDRHAHIYVFAMHTRIDEGADQRDASQWKFHVVPTGRLPKGKSIGFSGVSALAPAIEWDCLFGAVETERARRNR